VNWECGTGRWSMRSSRAISRSLRARAVWISGRMLRLRWLRGCFWCKLHTKSTIYARYTIYVVGPRLYLTLSMSAIVSDTVSATARDRAFVPPQRRTGQVPRCSGLVFRPSRVCLSTNTPLPTSQHLQISEATEDYYYLVGRHHGRDRW